MFGRKCQKAVGDTLIDLVGAAVEYVTDQIPPDRIQGSSRDLKVADIDSSKPGPSTNELTKLRHDKGVDVARLAVGVSSHGCLRGREKLARLVGAPGVAGAVVVGVADVVVPLVFGAESGERPGRETVRSGLDCDGSVGDELVTLDVCDHSLDQTVICSVHVN